MTTSKDTDNRLKIFSSAIWVIAERFSASVVSFIVSIVLARMLMPEDFGLVSMILVFITLADVFINSGFNTALIQKKDADELDFSTVFWSSMLIAIILYIVLYMIAPLIAQFYKENELGIMLQVFALRIPLAVPNSIQHAFVSRHMLFRKFFFSTLISTISSGIIGVVMAIMGMGPYALIGQYFAKTVFDTAVLSFIVEWRPKLMFSWERAKSLMRYGTAVFIADFSGQFFNQLRGLIIGRFYAATSLAFYNWGQLFPQFISANISGAVMTVLFPAFANEADNIERIKTMTRRALKTMAFIFFPLMIGLACVAQPLIELLLGARWDGCVFFVQVLSLSTAISLWGDVSLQTLKAIGQGGALVKLELVKKPVYVVLLVIGVLVSVEAVGLTMMIYSLYGTIVNMHALSKYTGYSISQQIRDVIPEIGMTIAMGSVVIIGNTLVIPTVIKLLLQVTSGVLVCASIAFSTRMESWLYVADYLDEERIKLTTRYHSRSEAGE